MYEVVTASGGAFLMTKISKREPVEDRVTSSTTKYRPLRKWLHKMKHQNKFNKTNQMLRRTYAPSPAVRTKEDINELVQTSVLIDHRYTIPVHKRRGTEEIM